MNPTYTPRLAGSLALALLLAACSAAAPPEPAAPAARTVPPGVHWVRTAAEHRVIFETTYREAGAAVEVMAAETDGPWGVILDADETVLDNSEYQRRRALLGLGYTTESWNDWVREEAATILPGALEFTRRVEALGGHVAIVTNRRDVVCEETRRNLTALGVPWDVVLCRTGASEKETRFGMVQSGTTGAGLPPIDVVAWVGDNIHDFPGGGQELRGASVTALADFGRRFFVLPNPMYGSWEGN